MAQAALSLPGALLKGAAASLARPLIMRSPQGPGRGVINACSGPGKMQLAAVLSFRFLVHSRIHSLAHCLADSLLPALARGFTPGALPACALALACAAAPARAADHIDTDGPDYVESTEVVGRGRFQFETGPQRTHDMRAGAHLTTDTTPLLLKAGISDQVEARLETEGYTHLQGEEAAGTPAHLRAMANTALGLKWHVQDGGAGTPALAWILHAEMPSGSPALRGLGLRPSLRAVIGFDLPGEFTLGVMPGIKLDTREDGHRYGAGILGLVLGRWWTPRLRAFVEGSAEKIARGENGGSILYKDVGAAYLLSDNWQLGGRAGWAANRNTPSRYVMLSLAGRF